MSYGRKYSCYICNTEGIPPNKLVTRYGWGPVRDQGGEHIEYTSWEEYQTDLSGYPANLHRCPKCGKWVCSNCSSFGINEYKGLCNRDVPKWLREIQVAEKRKRDDVSAENARKNAGIEEALRQADRQRQEREEALRRSWKESLEVYRSTYRCHILGCKYEANPLSEGAWTSKPIGMRECEKCGRLTCPNHLFFGKCEDCHKKEQR